MVDMLQADGIDISMDEVRGMCGAGTASDSLATRRFSGVIGRPHVAAALVKKGYAQNVKEVFVRYLGRHAPYYVPLERVDVRQAADIIIGAGGKPALAHPGLMSGRVLNDLLPKLKLLGFWGIEAYHPAHTNGQCRIFASAARRRGLWVCAGSDFHGSSKPDIVLGAERRGGAYLQRSFCALLSGY
jgi:predicted metal-dependent phosphoesterase TrpH